MAFNSYIEWLEEVKKLPLNDIIFGVKNTIEPQTLYISLGNSKNVRMDNFQFTIGYTYNLVISVTDVDSPIISALSNLSQEGMQLVDWSKESQLYNYAGTVYLPCKTGENAFE